MANEGERLNALWAKRPSLTEAEWAELWAIVHRILSRTAAGSLYGLVQQLPDPAEDYIAGYFVDKVFIGLPTRNYVYPGALKKFFRHYLLSQIKSSEIRNIDRSDTPEGTSRADQALDHHACILAADSSLSPAGISALEEEIDSFLEGRSREPSEAPWCSEHGIDLPRVIHAAREFLQAHGDWEKLAEDLSWIQCYLSRHFCASEDQRISLSTLARQNNISSYHNKVTALGLFSNQTRNRSRTLESFRSSYLGQWLRKIGLSIHPDHWDELKIALKILCQVALQAQTTQSDHQPQS